MIHEKQENCDKVREESKIERDFYEKVKVKQDNRNSRGKKSIKCVTRCRSKEANKRM